MSESNKGARAGRLRTEAMNCLTIAVHEQTASFAAQLIDEATKLMKRSGELSRPTLGGAKHLSTIIPHAKPERAGPERDGNGS